MTHSRERSYIIFQCWQQIADLYGLKDKTRDEVKELVRTLLRHDRYMCKAEDREVRIVIWRQNVIDAERRNVGMQETFPCKRDSDIDIPLLLRATQNERKQGYAIFLHDQ